MRTSSVATSRFCFHAFLLLVPSALRLWAQTPEWIWYDNKGAAPPTPEIRFFRKIFELPGPVEKAVLTGSGDDRAIFFINGRPVLANRSWNQAVTGNVTRALKPGLNVIGIRGENREGDAAVIARLEITLVDGQKKAIVTDASWLAGASPQSDWLKPEFSAETWSKPAGRGKLGVQPWGDVMAPRLATPAETITVLPGFKVELIRSAAPGEGSWVSMTIDEKGRLIISPQGEEPMLRVTLSESGQIDKIEPIPLRVGSAMGLLYAFDSLYVSGNGPSGLGLYRLRDSHRQDRYDQIEFLKKIEGAAGEHGSHALVLGPDKMIYYVHGNFVKIPADISAESPHQRYAEDQLLPRQEDGNGFGVGIKPPGGSLFRMDPDAKQVELFAAGMRNTYDFAINPDGEIIAFDSDMEWDWGLPWYRPIRILHLVSGGDYGFREGSGKWPAYYPDSLPPVVDVGIGSPTGLKFGTQSRYPAKYQKALYAMDWSYGRIFAVHLLPNGASYSGTFETFLQGKPLNVTDLEFGHDGAMYFLTGGRGTQSGLYRVSYAGNEPVAPTELHDAAGTDARHVRHQLERFHGRKDSAAVETAWPHLDSPDRFIRYAARIAIESQDVSSWSQRALEETRTNASITALLALARVGDASLQPELIGALGRLSADELDHAQQLAALRVLELACIRMGRPNAELAGKIIDRLNPLYPANDEELDRELCQILIYFQAPDVVAKTLDLADRAKTQEEQIYYLFRLRTLKTGWTMDQRRHYFTLLTQRWEHKSHRAELPKWFADADREYSNGASFPKFMANIRKDALQTLTEPEAAQITLLLARAQTPTMQLPKPRPFVREWKVEDLLPVLDQASRGRSFAKGKEVFIDAQCIACHKFGEDGGSVGPDLTAVASRFSRRDILDSIIEPSKVVSEQYQNMRLLLKDGEEVTGRIVEDTPAKVVVVINPLTQDKTEVKTPDIDKRIPSKISPMPEGLVSNLTKDDILDLIAFLESGGKRTAAAFQSN